MILKYIKRIPDKHEHVIDIAVVFVVISFLIISVWVLSQCVCWYKTMIRCEENELFDFIEEKINWKTNSTFIIKESEKKCDVYEVIE